MTEEVGNILKGLLSDLEVGGSGPKPFIDKLAGVVKTIVKTDKDGDNKTVRKSFPVACGMSYAECVNQGRYLDLVPTKKIGCMVYFEDLGIRLIGRNGANYVWRASYRLVGWINMNKLGYDDCSITGNIIATILNKLLVRPANTGIYQRMQVEVVGQDPKSFDPFSKYSYDEEKTQYKMYPFDYFSLPIDVQFEVNPACAEDFEVDTEITCN